MNKITSIVGIVLIIAAGVLAAISSTKEDILNSKKVLCEKYTKSAQDALSKKEFDKAIKFAKLAIKADPENRLGYSVLLKITDAQCNKDASTQNIKKPAQEKPQPQEAEEEELGC